MYVPVKMDKTRNFRYGMRAISFIEKKFNKPIAKIDFNNLTMEETATIILAGLNHEDKELNEEKILDIIDEKGNFNEVLEAMNDAFISAFSGEGSNGENEKN